MSEFDVQIADGHRFRFGRNWQAFLRSLTEDRIVHAEQSLREMLRLPSLEGRRFLDIGCGSGLFSLAARRLGASVHSFDFDPESVACSRELKDRYFPGDSNWTIEEASILDPDYVVAQRRFDIVYSWGVLHHTGNMWKALDNAGALVAPAGMLFIAIYNDQGFRSSIWKQVKRLYCFNRVTRALILLIFIPYFFIITVRYCITQRRNIFAHYKELRGMSIVHDWIDWLGGYPFDVATVEQIFSFFHERDFILENIKTTASLGNNQFVFRKATRKA